jgi:hypothetical protein
MALNKLDLGSSTCVMSFGDAVELVKPLDVAWDAPMLLSLLSSVGTSEALSSMDADGVAAAAAMLASSSSRGHSLLMVFTDGYGTRGLRLSATLTDIAASTGVRIVAIGIGSEPSAKGNGLVQSYAHWLVCSSPSSFPAALQAWANAYHGVESAATTVQADSSVYFASELMSAAVDGVACIDDVYDRKHGSYFLDLDAQLNAERRVFVRQGGKESGGGILQLDVAFLMDCTYVPVTLECKCVRVGCCD